MNLKKALALLLCLVMVFALAACSTQTEDTKAETKGGNDTPSGETYELAIKVWVPELAVELTTKQIEDFNKTNKYNIHVTPTINALSEADTATQMLTDVSTGADLYFFAQDQFARLVKGSALSALPDQQAEIVAKENNAGVVAAGKAGDVQYAYPLTNDNGYFMYYDKSVIPESDVDSLEKLIEDCETANKYFAFEIGGNAWYAASFFFGAGCHSEWQTDDDGNFISIDDDFNSEKGMIAAKGMSKLVWSPCYVKSAKAEEFSNNAAVVVSGVWDYVNAQNNLGDNLGVTDLPSFEVDGKEYHLGSFSGCKLLGVKPQTDENRVAAIHILAEYLTSEAAQLERFDTLAWGPANLAAAASDAVKANPALVALGEQNAFATPQGNINGDWWSIAGAIDEEIKDGKTDADLQTALTNYDEKISAVFTKIEQNKNQANWGVVGSMTNWGDGTDDYPMTEAGASYVSDPIELKAGDELKCRKNADWAENYPAENVVVEADGYYIVVLDTTDGTVTLQPAEAPSWGVVGSMTGWGNDAPDYAMKEEGGKYVSEPIELKAGDELKCRFVGEWTENIGVNGKDGDNLKIEADGTYIITLDVEAATITADAQ